MTRSFPSGFEWGSATAAHQIEGGCTHVVVEVFAVFTNQDALPPGTPALPMPE